MVVDVDAEDFCAHHHKNRPALNLESQFQLFVIQPAMRVDGRFSL
jgi:hypothetical protein